MVIDAKEALRMALIDAIESRSALADGDSENREFHLAYLAAYRKALKRRYGSSRTPVERKIDSATFVEIWPNKRS